MASSHRYFNLLDEVDDQELDSEFERVPATPSELLNGGETDSIKSEEDDNELEIYWDASPPPTYELFTQGRFPYLDRCQRSRNAAYLMDRFQDSVAALADTLFRCDKTGISDACIIPEDEVETMTRVRIMHILLSMPWTIIQGLILGNLAAAQLADATIAGEMRSIRMRALHSNQPCVYYIAIANQDGRAPSPSQINTLVEGLQVYRIDAGLDVAKRKFIFKVDHYSAAGMAPATYDEVSEGRRKYTNSVRDEDRNRILEDFINSLQKRLCDTSWEPYDQPMSSTLGYVGFSKRVDLRFDNHANHRYSNWLMNLCEAVFSVVCPGVFNLHMMPVFLLWKQDQGKLAEVILTRLTQVYVNDAGGFVSSVPGRSNQGADVIDEQTEALYTLHRDQHSPFRKQFESEQARHMERVHQDLDSDKIDTLIYLYEMKLRLSMASLIGGVGRAALEAINWIFDASNGYTRSEFISRVSRYEEVKARECGVHLRMGFTAYDRECYKYLVRRRKEQDGSLST